MSLQNPIPEKFHHKYFKYLNYSFAKIVKETNEANLPDSLKQSLIDHYETIARNQTYSAYNDCYENEEQYKNALAAINKIRREFGLPYDDGKEVDLSSLVDQLMQEERETNQQIPTTEDSPTDSTMPF
jgi:hypothetical protein